MSSVQGAFTEIPDTVNIEQHKFITKFIQVFKNALKLIGFVHVIRVFGGVGGG